MKKIILMFQLISPLVLAQENYNQHSSLDINLEISSNIFVEETGNPELTYLDLSLYLVPQKSKRQSYSNLNTFSIPLAETTQGNPILFHWELYTNKMEYAVFSNITTRNIIYPIQKTEFPLATIQKDIEQYIKATETIDITKEISQKASELTEQETNLFLATYNIAEWVNKNINYDLNTLTAETVQKSSWVFENKEGVCDEITSLFISMLRSVGIPARFVGGVAYSNIHSQFENHGWAEVYFPGTGWVPYDITFTQYAWISPGHISLSKSQDPKDHSISLSSMSNGLQITSESPTIKTEVIKENYLITPILNMSLEILENNVAPESYVPFRVTVKNPLNHYIATTLFVTTAPGLTESNSKTLALEPYEEKDIFWIAKIPKAEPKKSYQTKLEIKDLFGSEAESNIIYSHDLSLFTKQEAESLIDYLTPENSYSSLLISSCTKDKEFYYNFEDLILVCTFENIANQSLKDLKICFKDCQSISLKTSEKKSITFKLNAADVPTNKILSVESQDLILNKYIPLNIYSPEIKITDINTQSVLDYTESTEISFAITAETELKNINLNINNQNILFLEKLEGVESIKLSTSGKSLLSGVNIEITYEDGYGNKYTTKKIKEIEIVNAPIYAVIIDFLKQLFQ